MDTKNKLNYLLAISAVIAGSAAVSQAQIQVAGTLLVDVNATAEALGTINAITNNGTMGGFFQARGAAGEMPTVVNAFGNGTKGIFFDGGDYMQHVASVGGPLVPADPSLTGVNPTLSIEAWVVNPGLAQEETILSWGHRGGGPDGSNMSLNYGWDAAWGAIGHWGSPDMGWDPSSASPGANPLGNPKSGVWHHLVYTYDGTTQKVYSDGVLLNSETVGLNIFPNPAIMLGAQYDNDTVVTGGLRGRMLLSQVRIHSEALTAGQVSNNYTFEKGGYDSNLGSPLPFHPAHRYSFSNPAGAAPNGSTVLDSEGTAHGTIRGAGANFTGTRVTLPGGSSATQGYIDLPNGLLSVNSTNNGGLGQVTMEGWVKVTGGRSWARIFDFGSSAFGEVGGAGGGGEGTDYLFLSAQEGDNVNRHVIDIRNIDGVPTSDPAGPGYDSGNFNRDFHFALTWDEATGAIIVYENGAAVDGFSATPTAISDIHDVNVWLGRSNWAGDQNMQGEFDEFRIYGHVLTPDQVRASFVAGPNALATADPASISAQPQSQTIPEFGSVSFNAAAQGALPITLRWYKNGSFTGLTADTISYSNVPLSDDGSQYFVIASNNIGGTSFYATSQVATLTVLADTNPPTLVQARMDATNVMDLLFSENVNPADLVIAGNFVITGSNAPTVLSAAVGSGGLRVLLTLSGPLTGCEFYVVTVTGVHDVSAGANVITAPNNKATLWNYGISGLTHRYNFNDPAATDATGAAVVDSVAGANGIIRNNGGVTRLTGSRITLGGGDGSVAPYVDLPNGLVSVNSTNNGGSGQLTFEGWVKITGNQSWSRIFDFGATDIGGFVGGEVFAPGPGAQGIDYLFYAAQTGNNTGNRRLDRSNRDGGDFGNAGVEFGVSNFGQDFHFVVTWDEATGLIRVFEDGVLRGSMTTAAGMDSLNDVNVWLGRSVWTVDRNLQGEYDEFRVYNKVLSTAEIQLNRAGGADNNFGALLSFNLLPSTNNLFTNTVGSVQVLAGFSAAGTQNLAAAACIVYSSSDSNVVYVTSDGVLHAANAGTATITATFGAASDSEVITVSADDIKPVLLGARALTPYLIDLTFSEPISPGSAAESSDYVVSGPGGFFDVNSSEAGSNPSHVLLHLAGSLPCEYITVTVNFVTDQSPLANQILPDSTASFMNFVPSGLKHRYTFNGAAGGGASGTVIPDAVGVANGVILGNGASLDGNRVVLPGGSSGSAAYVDLPNGLLSTNAVLNGGSGKLTFEGWVKVTGIQTWARIFDIGDSAFSEVLSPGGGGEGKDYFMLTAAIGGDVNNRRVELRNEDPGGGGIRNADHATAGFNQVTHFVVTWDEAASEIRTYEDGVQVSIITGVSTRMSDINDVNVWLGRSNWTGDSNMQGEFDEFRVYNRILTAAENTANQTVGPDYNFGAPLAVRVAAASPLQFGQTAATTVNADFAGLANYDLTLAGCYTLQSSDPSVVSVDAAGVLHALGNGTASIIVRFSGLSNSVPITVTGGQTPDPDHITFTSSGGVNTVSFHGVPGTSYRIRRTTDLTAPVTWTTLTTQTAPPSGIIAIQDTNPPAGQAFYQAITP